jgi:putative ABC transport system permease protein
MLLQIAWKNIWRNKVRSLVILTAIALGIFAGVFSMGFYKGMAEQRVKSAISTEASHIQIHQKGYITDPNIKSYIPHADEITSSIDTLGTVKHSSSRIIVNSMITSAETGSGVRLIGIDVSDEKQVTDLYTRLVDGKYLEGIKRNPILIGDKLAEKLNVKIRSKVVLTLQNMEGEMMYASFRVAGIYKTSNTMYDESTAFVRKEDIAKLINLEPTAAHEIAILLNSSESLDETMDRIEKEYSKFDVKNWKEIMPEVALVEQSMDIPMYIFMGVILFALLFGIINTMLMAVLERRKELGMLMAIGMVKVRVFRMIMLESVLLSLTGGVLGIIIGALITVIFSKIGINLSSTSQGYEALGYDPFVYPVFKMSMAVIVTIMVLITGFLASIYPAFKALKLKPADAIRIDM